MQGSSNVNNHSKVVKWQNNIVSVILIRVLTGRQNDSIWLCNERHFLQAIALFSTQNWCCSLNGQLVRWPTVKPGALFTANSSKQSLKTEDAHKRKLYGSSHQSTLWPTISNVFQNSISKIVLSSFYILPKNWRSQSEIIIIKCLAACSSYR